MNRSFVLACVLCVAPMASFAAQERMQPLWHVPQESLQDAVRRPLFTPDRKGVPYVAEETADGAILQNPSQNQLDVELIGVIMAEDGLIVALVNDHSDQIVKRLHTGDRLGEWNLISADRQQAVFQRGTDSVTLNLRKTPN